MLVGGQSVNASLELGGKEGFGSIELVQGELLSADAKLRSGQLCLSLFAEGFASAEQDIQVELSAPLGPYRSKHE